MKPAAGRRSALLVLGLLVVMMPSWGSVAWSADKDPNNGKPTAKAADEDLLEFLGSVGGEDAEFTDYLSRTDIAQVAKPPPPKPAPPPPEVKKS